MSNTAVSFVPLAAVRFFIAGVGFAAKAGTDQRLLQGSSVLNSGMPVS
jgi:hypothetical protein